MSLPGTIVAIATPPGRGGIGVVRISGSLSKAIAEAILGAVPQARRASMYPFRREDGTPIDVGLAVFFPAPHSFTGEDVLELHGHGGPIVQDLLLARVISLGARLAAPGEFSERAFLNDKLDLVQAESIADLIDSGSAQAARAAMRSLQGEFSKRAQQLTHFLIEARTHVEAAIDFPEEEIDFLEDRELQSRLVNLKRALDETLKQAQQGALLRDGMTVVIAGRPNAGKSSLLNALAGYEAAIVTAIPGTTRDVLRERIVIDGMPLHIIDTAGLRQTEDIVESEGIRRAHLEMSKADRVLYIVDGVNPVDVAELREDLASLPQGIALSVVISKCDIAPNVAALADFTTLRVSSVTGAGLAELRKHLKDCVGMRETSATVFSARRRHLEALHRADEHVSTAMRILTERKAGELVAEELRLAQRDLGELTGEFTSDDLLGKIFSSFCIGK